MTFQNEAYFSTVTLGSRLGRSPTTLKLNGAGYISWTGFLLVSCHQTTGVKEPWDKVKHQLQQGKNHQWSHFLLDLPMEYWRKEWYTFVLALHFTTSVITIQSESENMSIIDQLKLKQNFTYTCIGAKITYNHQASIHSDISHIIKSFSTNVHKS